MSCSKAKNKTKNNKNLVLCIYTRKGSFWCHPESMSISHKMLILILKYVIKIQMSILMKRHYYVYRKRSRMVPSAGASVSWSWGAPFSQHVDMFTNQKLSEFHHLGFLMEVSLCRHDLSQEGKFFTSDYRPFRMFQLF